jgi:hypothetical protein
MARKPSSASSLWTFVYVESLNSWVRASEVVRVFDPEKVSLKARRVFATWAYRRQESV